MKFQNGNKLSRGGKKGNKGGRPTNQQKANEAEAIRIAREMLAACFGELIELAKKVCKGVKVRKHHPRTGVIYYEKEYDTATLRFLIDRFIPAARQSLDVTMGTPEEFYQAIAEAKRNEKALERDRHAGGVLSGHRESEESEAP
jgi:hypothetical protein